MNIETINPKTPEKAPKRKYKVPIPLWFVEKNQRTTQGLLNKAIEEFSNLKEYIKKNRN
jgi:hypothetical protein